MDDAYVPGPTPLGLYAWKMKTHVRDVQGWKNVPLGTSLEQLHRLYPQLHRVVAPSADEPQVQALLKEGDRIGGHVYDVGFVCDGDKVCRVVLVHPRGFNDAAHAAAVMAQLHEALQARYRLPMAQVAGPRLEWRLPSSRLVLTLESRSSRCYPQFYIEPTQ
jgi:hypothetical protein